MSKLTDDFGFDGYGEEDVKELLVHAKQLEEMLKKHQRDMQGQCVECRSFRANASLVVNHEDHHSWCKLAKLLVE